MTTNTELELCCGGKNRSPKGNEKQIGYIISKKRHLKYNEDADVCHGNIHDPCSEKGWPSRKKKTSSIQQNKTKGIKLEKALETRSLSSSTSKSENSEAEAKEADGEFSEIKVKNDVEAAGDTDEGLPGHRTVNEEAGNIVLLVEHDP